jgi:hypothetical protein
MPQSPAADDDVLYDYRGRTWDSDALARYLLVESGEFDDEDRDFYAGAPLDELIGTLAGRYGLNPAALDDFDTDVVPRPTA